jgi:hypothetical protein
VKEVYRNWNSCCKYFAGLLEMLWLCILRYYFFTVYKTLMKFTSLYHFFIAIDPYICFGLCKTIIRAFQNYIYLHPMVFLSLLLCNILPFTYKISLKSEFLKNVYRRTKYKIVENSLKFVSRR